MRTKIVWLVAVASLIVPLRGAVADADPAATALSTGEVLVDEVGGHVFVTASDTVAVFDLAGMRVGTISNQLGAHDLVLRGRTLYVLASDAGRINRVDADTFASLGGWNLPGVADGWQMAWVAGAFWITYGDQWGDGVARLDPSSGSVTLALGNVYAGGDIAGTDSPPRLYVFDLRVSSADVNAYDISSGLPVATDSGPRTNPCGSGSEMALAPAGTSAFIACGGSAPQLRELDRTSLAAPIATYPSGAAAATVSGNGQVLVGGSHSPYGPDIFVYDVGSPSALKVREVGPGNLLQGMLAATTTGDRVYAVTDGGALRVFDLRPSLSVRPDGVPAETVSQVPVTGSGLADVTSVTIGSRSVEFSVVSDSQLEVTVPELPAGTYPITMTSRWGTNDTSDLAQLDVIASGPEAPAPPAVTGTPPFAVSLAWAAPDSTSPITAYRVRAYVGDAAAPVAQRTLDGTATTTSFDGLIAETGYRFTVAGVNADGSGAFSTRSTPATAGLPDISPFASLTALVNRQYRDVVGRTPTSSERAMWLAALRADEATPIDVVLALRGSRDNRENVDAVARLYLAYFGRPADTSGLTFWTAKRRGGTSLASVSNSFAASSEFRRTYAALSNRQFVELVYQRVLGRPGDSGGVSYWTRQIDAGRKTRGTVMIGFSESSEYVLDQASEVTASVLPTLLMGRAPTAVDYQATIDDLDAGTTTPAALIATILASPEYADRIEANQ